MLDGRSEKWLAVCVLAVFAAALSGCGSDVGGGGAGVSGGYEGGGFNNAGGNNLGATPGGAQDIAYVRALIGAGSIPPSAAITVEGLLSEHDLPTMGEPCEDLLCVRPVAGLAPDLATGSEEMWVHLGMSSGFDADFVRPPADIVVVVDKSSSMSIDMVETNDAVMDILQQLRADDRVAVVTFDDTARTLIPTTGGADLDLNEADTNVRGLRAAGGANLMAGLELGYEVARKMESGADRMARVIVLSCGYPTVGDTAEGSFVSLVQDGAEDRVGLTFLGILLGFDYRLAERLSQVRGGNYYYLEDLQSVESLFEEEFDFIVTPLAYDLQLKMAVDSSQWKLDRVYGLPGEPGADEAGFEVSTAFLSKRGGGIIARFTPISEEPDSAVATINLAYSPESAHGWTGPVTSTTTAKSGNVLPTHGVRKAVALVNMAEQMKAAIDADDPATLMVLRDHLRAESIALGDPALENEAKLIEKLIALF